MQPILFGVILVGFLHGLEPSHGWPVAMVYSSRKKSPVLSGLLSSGILSAAHLLSSFAVVFAYMLLQSWLDFSAGWIKYAAATILMIVAIRFFTEKPDVAKQHGHSHQNGDALDHSHEHEHPKQIRHLHRHKHFARAIMSLKGLALFALILGFAHEEEFALIALVAGGVNGVTLMTLYGLSVAAALIGITLAAIKAYQRIQSRLEKYEKHIPKVGAAVLALMAVILVTT
jgi:ABC-type nickel/cobalt efflux system permease component RcnA